MKRIAFLCAAVIIILPVPALAADDKDLSALLGHAIIGPRVSLAETQEYCDARIPRMPNVATAEEWKHIADRLRADVLRKVVYRGEAAAWRDAKTKVEWIDTIEGGPGYRIKKLRFEALPSLWIPALLYEPEKLDGKVPVHLAVNGHDGAGKAASYKQIRCINFAKRGMIVLNVEWLGMGQLRTDGFAHYRMNQLDLCGTSGVAPFYLNMKRGLDVLLSHEHADPARVAVSGLSGGGWQTIFISSLDTRVTLANPVAGYSSFRTRVQHFKDLGDSEQTPCDLATVADYMHLTAMRAPRPTLLTFNSKDNCCFESGYALPPLLGAAEPMYKLLGSEKALRSHVNDVPGTHNFEKDNRQALYKMVGDFFYPGSKDYSAEEIPCDKEVKKKAELDVSLPESNANFNRLALQIMKNLPRDPALPTEKAALLAWQAERRKKLREIVRAKEYAVKAEQVGSEEKDGTKAVYWKLAMGKDWTVPVVELTRGEPKSTAILVGDAGRKALAAEAGQLLAAGNRVLAVDALDFGEAKIADHGVLFDLLIAAVGDRPLGIQASQLTAVAQWSQREHKSGPVALIAVGPRLSVAGLIAAGIDEKAIASLEVRKSFGSLKEIVEQNHAVNEWPEQFCFGLLEWFDLPQLTGLCAPRPARFVQPSERAKKELSGLKELYKVLGKDHEPLQ